MNRNKIVMGLFSGMLVFLAFIISCASSPPSAEDAAHVIGTWIFTDENSDSSITLVFKTGGIGYVNVVSTITESADGNMSYTMTADKFIIDDGTGKFTIKYQMNAEGSEMLVTNWAGVKGAVLFIKQ